MYMRARETDCDRRGRGNAEESAKNGSEFEKKDCIIRWVLCKFWLNLRRRRLRLNLKHDDASARYFRR